MVKIFWNDFLVDIWWKIFGFVMCFKLGLLIMNFIIFRDLNIIYFVSFGGR